MIIKHITIFSCETQDSVLNKILEALAQNNDVKYIVKMIRGRSDNAADSLGKQFILSDYIIFIASTGIATRYIGKLLKDKYTDPGVVVVDTLGKFAISLASGHIGGANELANLIGNSIGATPVITTATDINNSFAIDEFAKANDLVIHNPIAVKHMAISILQKEPVGVVGDYHGLNKQIKDCLELVGCNTNQPFPKNIIQIVDNSDNIQEFDNISNITLMPKNLYVGIGCKKNTPFYKLYELFESVFTEYKLDKKLINSITTIDIKEDELSIVQLARTLGAKLVSFSAEELNEAPGEFDDSEFVEETVGVGNVCERSAALASYIAPNGERHQIRRLVGKTSNSGVTISVYRRY